MKDNLKYKFNILFMLILLAVFSSIILYSALSSPRTAYAQEVITVAMSEKTVHRGQTFSLDIEVTNNTGLISMLLNVDYDPSVMKLIGVERKDGLPSMTMTTTNVGTEVGYDIRPFSVLFDTTNTITEEGVIVSLVFESNIESAMGDYVVSLTYDEKNTNSAYLTPVNLNTVDGIVHLISGEYTARYVDWDGSVLYSKDYNEGDVPDYVGDKPSRLEDDCYTYEFNGWLGDITDETNLLQYRAQYTKTPKTYSVFYYVDGLTNFADSSFDVDDFYMVKEFAYGEKIDLDIMPNRQNYTFVGWFADEELLQPIMTLGMPSHDIRVYGYMRYNVRVADIPKIRLTYQVINQSEIEVLVNLVYNSGINGMVLTLDYDIEQIKFVRYTRGLALESMQFDTTKTSGGLNQKDFRFYWESAENTTQTGLILSLVFDVSGSDTGIFPVTFTYDETHDATYVNSLGEIWYTRLDIVGTSVPIGERFHWNEPVGDVAVDVTSTDGKPLDVELLVKIADVQVSEAWLSKLETQNLEIKNKYSINLVRNGEIVTSESDLRIGLGLTKEELESQNLGLYYIDSNGNLVEYNFTIEDDSAIFNMRNIEYWVVVGEKPAPEVDKSWLPESIRSILLPSLLSLATMAYALVLLAQNNKLKKQLNNLKGKGGNK